MEAVAKPVTCFSTSLRHFFGLSPTGIRSPLCHRCHWHGAVLLTFFWDLWTFFQSRPPTTEASPMKAKKISLTSPPPRHSEDATKMYGFTVDPGLYFDWFIYCFIWLSHRPVARFQDLVGHATFLGGQDFCFYYMFETNFSGRDKIWGGTAPEFPPVSTGPLS